MYLKVIATPGARKERVEVMKDGVLHIAVKEPASGNHANTRIREIVAQMYDVPVNTVRILTGHHSRSKMISVLTK